MAWLRITALLHVGGWNELLCSSSVLSVGFVYRSEMSLKSDVIDMVVSRKWMEDRECSYSNLIVGWKLLMYLRNQ